MEKLNQETLILMDIHFRRANEKKYQELIQLLYGLDTTILKRVILLGDIFDFFLGNHSYFKKKYSKLITALEYVAKSECKVYFLHGNHEFSLKSLPWKNVKIITADDFILNFEGKKVAFCHGDLLFASPAYRAIIAFLRSRILLFFLKFIPGSFLDKICLAYADYSHSQCKPCDEKKMAEAAKVWLAKLGADEGFIGHFHKELHVELKIKDKTKKIYFLAPGLRFIGEK